MADGEAPSHPTYILHANPPASITEQPPGPLWGCEQLQLGVPVPTQALDSPSDAGLSQCHFALCYLGAAADSTVAAGNDPFPKATRLSHLHRPQNTGETLALAKMFNLSLMRVFIYKY